MTPSIEIFADAQTLCGEAPIWDAPNQRLLWVDNEQSRIFSHPTHDDRITLLCEDYPAFALALNHDGRLVMAGPQGIALLASDGTHTPVLSNSENGDYFFNDAIASPIGGLYAGSFHWGEKGMIRPGSLFHIAPDGTAKVMDEGLQLSNGLALSPDQRSLYFADTMARTIYAYDVRPDATLGPRRTFANIDREDGLPDGLAVDREGHVWCALWYGAQIIRFSPDGTIERRIDLPAQQVSSLAFGGSDLAELFVTTGSQYWASPDEPTKFNPDGLMGGAVYRLTPGFSGSPESRCRFS